MALTKIRGNSQIQNLSVTNTQIALKDAQNPLGIELIKIEDGDQLIKADGTRAFTAPVSGVTPTQASHLVTKEYVDASSQGLDAKESVRAISTSNIALTGTQTVDGVVLSAGDRVLVAGQDNAVQNGIYVVAAGAWQRAADATTAETVTPGLFTFVEEGSTYGATGWVLASTGDTVLGTTELPFVQFSAAGVTNAGDGLVKVGNNLNIVSSNGGIAVTADAIALTLDGSSLAVGPDGVKIADGTAGQVLVADANGEFRAVTLSGDVSIDSAGNTVLVDGAVDGNAIADGSLGLEKLEAGTAGQVIVAGAGGVPTYVTVSGDATLGADGNFQLGAGSVGTTELLDDAVTEAKLADNAVSTDKLVDDAVTEAKLADNAVTTPKIADEAVTLEKLETLGAAQLIIGSAGGNTAVTLSGDVTLSEAGVVTINPATVVRVADIIKSEAPAGALDGVNTTFVLANEPKAGTVDVYVNGILQDLGGGNDYTLAGGTITLNYTLTAADKIRVSYFK